MQEEEEWERCSSTGGDPQPGPSPPPLEGCSISDVSMADGLLQCDSNVIIEEDERGEYGDRCIPRLLPPCL